MSSTLHVKMHSEHRTWESEISLWRDDLRAWHQGLAKALSEIRLLDKALEDHAHALRKHASTLRLQQLVPVKLEVHSTFDLSVRKHLEVEFAFEFCEPVVQSI